MRRVAWSLAVVVLAAMGAVSIRSDVARPVTTSAVHPIISYVSKPDDAYTWKQLDEVKLASGSTAVRIEMISQKWQGIMWKHSLDIVRPAKVRDSSTALLMIQGGGEIRPILDMIGQAANAIGMPIAILFDIPNQPLFDGKLEDELIAYTFTKCIETGDMTWPLLYPMTKSAVRAMDTIQAASRAWDTPVKGFVVNGASKRGWTTWFTGSVDKRVVGIAPMVYDNLNLEAQMKQQVACYGKYSEAIDAYTSKMLPQFLTSDAGREFGKAVDPYTLRDRLTMPKLIFCGTNDPYWTLESANLYWNDLLGDKHITYIPNTGHDLLGKPESSQRFLAALGAFCVACSDNTKLPQVNWSYKDSPDALELTIKPEKTPSQVSVWTAESKTKDFRKSHWTERKLTSAEPFKLPRPKTGYAAIYGEATYKGDFGPVTLCTTAKMVGGK